MATSQSLSSSLSEMACVLDRLIGLSEEKRDVLVRGDVSRLSELVASEEGLVTKLDQLEQERVRLHPFSDAKDSTEEAGSDGVSETLRKKLLQLRRLNEVNMALVKSSLQVVQHGLKILLPQQSGYGNASTTGPLVFDRKS
ncbi:MAG TPA: flagellar protein FlgN [Firmicutes bacterium]|nr:flagellar protein FlgN [Candidatus Fermentithermobacillaceae bacterium]